MISYISRQIAPALFFVASMRIWRRGPAAELATWSMSPATKSRTIKKTEPVNVPMPTQDIMIFGPSMEALGTSAGISHCHIKLKAIAYPRSYEQRHPKKD